MKSVIIFSLLILAGTRLYADGTHPQGIKLDGTLGNSGKLDLPGPDYDIRSEYGKQSGANLFHSFQQFNLHKGESATFSGSDSVQNIISRVSGGNVSWIDGKLASDIPNANLYFLNPAGVMFGPNASLDLTGSFHVSTADYLRLGENERFYAMPQSDELLSAASPAAFGFSDNSISGISLEGRGEISADEGDSYLSGLSVSEGKTLSLVGGDIEISKGTFYPVRKTDGEGNPVFQQAGDENDNPIFDENGNPVFVLDEKGNPVQAVEKISPGDIKAPGGRINIVSAASPGEVTDTETGPDMTCPEKGNIRLSDKAVLDSSGGSIFIRGGQFALEDSILRSETSGDKAGGKIDVQADTVSLAYGAEISGSTSGSGKGADILIQADDSLRVFGANSEQKPVIIATETLAVTEEVGDAGNIKIVSGSISFADGAVISSNTRGNGKGGEISLNARDSVSFAGKRNQGIVTGIEAASAYFGDAGSLSIEADTIAFNDGAFLNSTTYGQGKGGEISLKARDSVFFSDSIIQVLTVSQEENAGNAGSLQIEAGNIFFDRGALITSNTYGHGKGGKISLNARDSVSFVGKESEGMFTGIDLSSRYSGECGSLSIEAENILLNEKSFINSTAWAKGKGGEITLTARDSVLFDDSIVQTATVSDEDGAGNAGRLLIGADKIFFRGATLDSNTYGKGNGCQIDLRAETIRCTADSSGKPTRIYAGTGSTSERAGAGGEIRISAQNLSLADRAEISTSSLSDGKAGDIVLEGSHIEIVSGTEISSESNRTENGGEAGLITVNADSLRLSENSSLTTEAKGAGGGRISLNAGNSLYLHDSQITSSVKQGYGNGGDVAADSKFVILNQGSITANAEEGDGGAVFIRSENFIKSSESRVEATSARGNQGTVEIQAPDLDIAESLSIMPGNFLDAAKWAVTPCRQRSGENISRFVFQGRDATPLSFDDWQPGPVTEPADSK